MCQRRVEDINFQNKIHHFHTSLDTDIMFQLQTIKTGWHGKDCCILFLLFRSIHSIWHQISKHKIAQQQYFHLFIIFCYCFCFKLLHTDNVELTFTNKHTEIQQQFIHNKSVVELRFYSGGLKFRFNRVLIVV